MSRLSITGLTKTGFERLRTKMKVGDLVCIAESESERFKEPGIFMSVYQTEEERPFTGGIAFVLYSWGVEKVHMNGLNVLLEKK